MILYYGFVVVERTTHWITTIEW